MYPRIVSLTETSYSAGTLTTFPMNYPASGVLPGDLFIAFGGNGSNGTQSVPTGYTQIGTNTTRFQAAAKIADGTEGGSTASWTTTAGSWWWARVYQIRNWYRTGTLANAYNANETALASTTSLVFGSVTTGGIPENCLILAAYHIDLAAAITGPTLGSDMTWTTGTTATGTHGVAWGSADKRLQNLISFDPTDGSYTGTTTTVGAISILVRGQMMNNLFAF